mgnify:CR=1 FL=1
MYFLAEMVIKNAKTHQSNLFGTDLLLQLDPIDPLLKLTAAIVWQEFERSGNSAGGIRRLSPLSAT